MREVAGDIPILPSILESEQYKKAIDQGKTLTSVGYTQLEYPFQQIVEQLPVK
jgi:chromosome partitioning protein